MTIRRADGTTITWSAKEPPQLDLTLTYPDRLQLPGIDPIEIGLPPAIGLDLHLTANWRHGLTVDRQPVREDDHHG